MERHPTPGQLPDIDRKTKFHSSALLVPMTLGAYLFLTSNFNLVPNVALYDGKRVLQPFVFLVLFLIPVFNPALRLEIHRLTLGIPTWVKGALAGAFALAIISSLRFETSAYSLADVGMLGLLLLGSLIVAASRRICGSNFDKVALFLVAMIGVSVAIQETMGLLANWQVNRPFIFDQTLIQFAHPRFYNQVQSWTLPLLAGIPLVFSRSRTMIFTAAGLLALQWCILLLSGGRGALVSITLSLSLVTLLGFRVAHRWSGFHLAGVVLGCVLFALVSIGNDHAPVDDTRNEVDRSERQADAIERPLTDSTGRLHMWRLAITQAGSHPVLGAGPARYSCGSAPMTPAHPHNLVLQLVSEWGVPAALLWLSGIAWLVVMMLRRLLEKAVQYESQEDGFAALLAAGLLAAALHSNLTGTLVMPAGQMIACLVIGWSLGYVDDNGSTNAPARNRKTTPLFLGLGLALTGWLMAFSVSELRTLDDRIVAERPTGPDQPRYWHSGRICDFYW